MAVLCLLPSSSVGGSSWLSLPLKRRLEQPVEERDKLEKEREKSNKKKKKKKGAKWNTYHGEVPLQAEKDLVSLYGPEFGMSSGSSRA